MRKLTYLCLTLWMALSLAAPSVQAQFNPQTDKITRTFFPEMELSSTTPGLVKTSGFTTYAEMTAWLEPLLKAHPDLLSLTYIGKSQKGKAIPMLRLTRAGGKAKTRVWLQGGLHGDEPAGTEAMLYLIEQLLSDTAAARLLDDLDLAIVPMANIDGYEKQQRASANGTDLNRDQTRLQAPESIALKAAFSKFQPSVALDFHEYRPYRKDFTRLGEGGITSLYDAMFLYSGNLNVPEPLRAYTKATFVDAAKHSLDAHHLRHHDYVTTEKYGGRVDFNLGSVHARSSATSYALANSVSTLLEIRGVGLGRTSFRRRVKTSYLIALSYLQTARQEQARLASVLKTAGEARGPVVVTSEKKVYKDTLQVIDLVKSREMGLPVTIHSSLQSLPGLVRKRPTAYLLLPHEKAAAFRLSLLGLKLDSLASERELEVEVLSANAPIEAEAAGEEEDEPSAKPKEAGLKPAKRSFPRGTYIVYTGQERAGLAFEVLEPENANSFAAGKIVTPKGDGELPVYRYMKPDPIQP